jgi:O-antigen/teichoic acid export membrane protein
LSDLAVARQSVRGSLILFVGNLISTIILTVTVIVIARLLGPSAYGVYTLSFVIPGIFQLFLGVGVTVAVTRYAAFSVAQGKADEAKRFTKNAIKFLLLFGVGLTLLSLVSATALSGPLLRRPDIGQYVEVASVAILGQALFQSSVSASVGWNEMALAGISSVVQALLKLAVSVVLILAGLGVLGAVTGNVASVVFGGAFTVSVLFWVRLRGSSEKDNHFLSDVREMVRYGLPVYSGFLVAGLAATYMTIVLAAIATNAVVGYYQAAANLAVPIGLVSSSIATALFPAFAALDGVGGDTSLALKYAVKYVSLLATPIVVFLISSSSLLFEVFYGPTYSFGVVYLNLLATANLPVALGFTVLPAFFAGLGRTNLSMYSAVAGALALSVLAPLLGIGLGFGISGLIYALFASNALASVVALVLASRRMGVTIDLKSTTGTLAASFVALLATGLTARIPLPSIPALILNVFLFSVIYLTTAPVLRAVGRDDLDRLRAVLREPKFVGTISEPFLKYMELVMNVLIGRPRKASLNAS